MKSHFLIAAPHSGSGKTTVTLGLLAGLQRKGYKVQPFKCGPDYIDPIHHRTAAGRDSINLDPFMMSNDHIRGLFDQYGKEADICIVEGVMGLFDGSDKQKGSSAEIAKLLDLPVILILNARAMAYSAAAILYGMKNFDPMLRIGGVIFNFVDSPTHYQLLTAAAKDMGINALGHLPANPGLRIPSRHLGLDTAEAGTPIGAAADHIEKHIDLAALLAHTQTTPAPKKFPSILPISPAIANDPVPAQATASPAHDHAPAARKILIARDEAFHFLYPENIRRLEEWGPVSYFSPMRDEQLPFQPDLLYLPGGYPELYLETLSGNKKMLRQIGDHVAAGGPTIAECGGMMYLGRMITDKDGNQWPMAGVLDIATSMVLSRLTIGYRSVRLGGQTVKGHEFHYSRPVGEYTPSPIEVFNARGDRVETVVFFQPRQLASYAHFYWGENPQLLEWLFERAATSAQ